MPEQNTDPVHVEATARKVGRLWVIETDHEDLPDVTVNVYTKAVPQLVELVSATLGVEPEAVTVTITPQLPDDIAEALRAAREHEAAADRERAASDEARQAALVGLTSPPLSLSIREAAEVLGISYQRVYQLKPKAGATPKKSPKAQTSN